MDKNAKKLNEMGRQWYALSEETDGAAKKALEQKIFIAIYDLVTDESLLEVVGDFFLKNWKEFDPNRMELTPYVWSCLKYRKIDLFRKDNHVSRVTVKGNKDAGKDGEKQTIRKESEYKLSLNYSSGNEEEDGTLENILADRDAETALYDKMFFDETLLQFVTLALNFSDRLKGKANNPTRLKYYRLFFTDDVVDFVQREKKEEILDVCRSKERDIFSAMELTFLDFFESEPYRTITEVSQGRLKPYGLLVEGGSMDGEVKLPLPNEVYMSYFERVEGKTVKKASSVSDQHRAYREFLRNEIC